MIHRVSYTTEHADASRAPINMVHDNVALTVSQDEASRAEDEAKRRLLHAKKLSLVVDLDQTVIQATVDPTVAEWQKDPSNPNYDAVKDVRPFQLTEPGPGGNGSWYYIKLRPGLQDFLEKVSEMYELHIYTMGTRSYAEHIATIIDPQEKIFGQRILSRSENGSFTVKSLQRLFPVDTKMVVIIDDRGDVWNWIPNLIRVTPYDFFVGIGDINSSFLPKRPQIPKAPKVAPPSTITSDEVAAGQDDKATQETKTNGTGAHQSEESPSLSQEPEKSSASDVSAIEQLVSMGGGDDPSLLQEQIASQDVAISNQVADRPLLQKQKQLEEKEAASESASQEKDADGHVGGDSDSSSDSDKPRHNLLQDDDRELIHLEQGLRSIHKAFFDAYSPEGAGLLSKRLNQLKGQASKASLSANSDIAMVPDIKMILPQVKRAVLEGVTIVFSGVVPLGVDVQSCDLAMQAKSYGARVEERVSKRITHVVAAKPRTAKTKQADMRKKKVVAIRWLLDSIIQWRKLDETPYIMKYDGASQNRDDDSDDILSDSDDEAGSSFDTEDDDSQNSFTKNKLSLTVNTNEEELLSDTEGLLPLMDEKSPIGGTKQDWDDMQGELADFLGSDAEDSDSEASGIASVESNKSTRSNVSIRGNKRQRNESAENSEDDSPSRKKRGTALRHTLVAGDSDSGLPTPDVTAGEEGVGNKKAGEDGEPPEGDGWSDFADDLEAEMAKDDTDDG